MRHYRRFISALTLFALCLFSAPGASQSSQVKRADPIAELLNYPAPPPGEYAQSPYGFIAGPDFKGSPRDDAPIEHLIEFWSIQDSAEESLKPSSAVCLRLLEACEKDPENLPSLLDVLADTPETHEGVKNLLDRQSAIARSDEDGVNESWNSAVKRWLMMRSRFFRDELIEGAGQAADQNGRVNNEEELRALAKLDWAAAQPVLEKLAAGEGARTSALALALIYERSVESGGAALAESLRARLKSIVADRRAPGDARNTAYESLLASEWNGRDEWYLSLFGDDSLRKLEDETETFSPLNTLVWKEPDKWIPIIVRLVGHQNRAIHDAAVDCLANLDSDSARRDALLPLLPWLTDPKWSAAEGRSNLIRSLEQVKMPESVSGLIWIVDHDEDDDFRSAAADALAAHRDVRAVPALRRALERDSEADRENFVKALIACGGLTIEEMAKAVESLAARLVNAEGQGVQNRFYAVRYSEDESPATTGIGQYLSQLEGSTEALTESQSEELATTLLERVKTLQSRQPKLAASILSIIQEWPLRIVALDLVQRLSDGRADAEAIASALGRRSQLREGVGDELRAVIKQGGQARGVAIALLGDSDSARETLESKDREAQRALLACARLVREQLPVDLAASLLARNDPALALAAERYLESEDSAEARKRLLARHPGEVRILGARGSLYLEDDRFAPLRQWEDKLRDEVKSVNGADEIFALLDGNSRLFGRGYRGFSESSLIVRVRDGRASLVWHNDQAREQYRNLTESEMEELRSFISEHSIDDLGPLLRFGHHGSSVYEYLHLTRDGGRRVTIITPGAPDHGKTPHNRLSKLFFKLTKTGDFKLRYRMENDVPGLEVLHANDEQPVEAVCKSGQSLSVLIAKKRNDASQSDWRDFSEGRPGRIAERPAACSIPGVTEAVPETKLNDYRNHSTWQSRAGSEVIRSGEWNKQDGLWRCSKGHDPVLLLAGPYSYPLVTPDGKWLVAVKGKEHRNDMGSGVRISLATGREYKLVLSGINSFETIAFIPAQNKVLIRVNRDSSKEELEHRLLDPNTGLSEITRGEFRPLTQQTWRPLQPTARPGEFWAAIEDEKNETTEVGRYDARRLVFTPLARFPKIRFDSMNMWVDESESRIYVAYHGHLLRLPLQR